LTAVVIPLSNCPGGNYVFPADFEMNALPPFGQLDAEWAYEHGGYSASGGPIQVVIQGKSDSTVVLLGMSVHVTARMPIGDVAAVRKCVGAGDLYPRYFIVNLDESDHPTAKPVAGDGGIPGDGGDPAVSFPYRVSRSEPEVFWLIPTTSSCKCSWRATINWISGDTTGEVVVDFDGEPLRVAAVPVDITSRDYSPDGS